LFIGAVLFFSIGPFMNSQNIDFRQLPSDSPQPDMLRLAHGQNGVVLVVSRTSNDPILGATTVFSETRPKGSSTVWSTLATFNQVVPATPVWDISPDAARKLQFVLEVPGGAINSLALHLASGEQRTLTANSPFQSFSSPRFEKLDNSSPEWITAVVDNRDCVAISITSQRPNRSLGPCSEGLLVRLNKSFLFIYKKTVPGPVRGNNISPGQLFIARLDNNMGVQGLEGSTVLFGGSTVFQFDAGVVGNKVAIVASTASGIEAASYSDQGTTAKLPQRAYGTTAVTSPTIAEVGNGMLLLAAMRSSGKDQQAIVIAEIPVP
jgi:hypothetical protein